jgi:hypothetical protein
MATVSVRSQPGTIDYTGNDPAVARLFTLAEEMFEILFQDLKRVSDNSGSSLTFTAGTGISISTSGDVVTITNTGPTMPQVAARVALGV